MMMMMDGHLLELGRLHISRSYGEKSDQCQWSPFRDAGIFIYLFAHL